MRTAAASPASPSSRSAPSSTACSASRARLRSWRRAAAPASRPACEPPCRPTRPDALDDVRGARGRARRARLRPQAAARQPPGREGAVRDAPAREARFKDEPPAHRRTFETRTTTTTSTTEHGGPVIDGVAAPRVAAPAPAPKARQAPRQGSAALPAGPRRLPAAAACPSGRAARRAPRPAVSTEALEQNARLLEGVLEDFGVRGEIINVRPGPVVTLYELEPAPGIKSSRVIGLADDIARSMSAVSARVAVVPGPQRHRHRAAQPEARDRLSARAARPPRTSRSPSSSWRLCLGKTIGGEPVIAELARMPHLLVAGTTGSGKSVAINTMILSLLYRLKPEECRLIMVDPEDAGALRL